MIETIMYFGLGFLVAALIGLVVIPLVHGRAVRLTMRRLEAAIPLSMAEVQADKDQLRAEFAMSTRRLEMNVEQLKAKGTSQLVELGRKGDAINRLKIEFGAARDQLRATEEELAFKTTAVHEAERALCDKELNLAKPTNVLDERSAEQKVEITALTMQVQTLKERITQAGEEFRAVEDRRDAERRRAQDLENRLRQQSRLLNESEFELAHLRTGIEIACKAWAVERAIDADVRPEWNERTARGAFQGR